MRERTSTSSRTSCLSMQEFPAGGIYPNRRTISSTVHGRSQADIRSSCLFSCAAYTGNWDPHGPGIYSFENRVGVVKQASGLAIVGAAVGLVAAFIFTPLLRTFLYGVDITDTSIFLGCMVLLVAVAAAASIIPAYRAAKLDPTTCLRCE